MKKSLHQSGFTLVELLVTVILIGIITAMMSPVLGELIASQRMAYTERHRLNNQLIAGGLVAYARNSTANGRLPAPYSGTGYTTTIYNPADTSTSGTALTQALTQTGVSVSEINDDGTAGKMVRVYQLLATPTISTPLYFQSGPLVTLNYDFGSIYLTACGKTNGTCNPSPSGVPGDSPILSATNFATYATTGSDGPVQFVSSLPVQKEMLQTTTQRLDKVRTSLVGYLRSRQISAAAGDTSNWYPNQLGTQVSGSLLNAAPLTNQGCRDGWYGLATSTTILLTIGLSPEEFGRTAWGGEVQYCRDYDPTGSGAANAPPHYGAIRINRQVSTGVAPTAVAADNVVLTF